MNDTAPNPTPPEGMSERDKADWMAYHQVRGKAPESPLTTTRQNVTGSDDDPAVPGKSAFKTHEDQMAIYDRETGQGPPTDNKATPPSEQPSDAEAGGEPKNDAGTLDSPEAREEYVQCTRALYRSQAWTKDEIQGMSETEVLERGRRLVEHQRKIDERIAQADDQRRRDQGSTNERDTGSGDQDDDPSAADDPDEYDLNDDQKRLKAKRDKELADAIHQRDTAVMKANFQGSIGRLSEKFPQLKDDGNMDDLFVQLRKLDPQGETLLSGTPDQIDELLTDASFIAFGATIKSEAEAERAARHQHLDDGQPDTSTKTGQHRNDASRDDFEKAAYNAVNENRRDINAARRKLSGAGFPVK